MYIVYILIYIYTYIHTYYMHTYIYTHSIHIVYILCRKCSKIRLWLWLYNAEELMLLNCGVGEDLTSPF